MLEESRMRVLVVDDDLDIRFTVMAALEVEGYETREAANGHLALLALQEWHADVIVLDLNMPVCDAWQFREYQRADAELQTIPIVLMSARHDLSTVRPQLDPAALLSKPFSLQELYDAVEGCLPTLIV